MILERKRALAVLKEGDGQSCKRVFDATYEDVYCRTLLIMQDEIQTLSFMEEFYTVLFGAAAEAAVSADAEKWFWQQYYRQLRKDYHKLLEILGKGGSLKGKGALAEVPAALPLLHRILLVMNTQDGFTAEEISAIFGLAPEKVEGELGKLDSLLPALAKKQPENISAWLGSWATLLSGASSEILAASEADWVDDLFTRAATAAGVNMAAKAEKDEFEYFVADVDLSEEKPLRSVVPEPEPEEESDEDEDDDEDDEYDDEDEDDEDDDDDDRYDWDLEDDSRKMIILGVVLALVLVAVIAFGVHIFMNRDSGSSSVQTEESADADAELVIKGETEETGEEETEEVEEVPEETEETEETEAEAEEETTVTMQANTSSLNVRSEGSTNGDVLTQLTEGEQVEVLSDTSEDWVQIRCIEQDDLEGYVMTQYLSAVEE
ncbi:MAG: SH3 domain-containing protein [Lachnospiraceae bacterium]|nr:SH3 domain-containing protein [Lachnospiraceae bacterium]